MAENGAGTKSARILVVDDDPVLRMLAVQAIGAIGFAVIWKAISAPLWFLLPEEIMLKQNYPAALGLLFPLVGIGLAGWATYVVIRWKKFGRSVFFLATVPAPLGGMLRGELRCPSAIDSDELEIQLKCERRITSGSGKNRSTRSTIV